MASYQKCPGGENEEMAEWKLLRVGRGGSKCFKDWKGGGCGVDFGVGDGGFKSVPNIGNYRYYSLF